MTCSGAKDSWMRCLSKAFLVFLLWINIAGALDHCQHTTGLHHPGSSCPDMPTSSNPLAANTPRASACAAPLINSTAATSSKPHTPPLSLFLALGIATTVALATVIGYTHRHRSNPMVSPAAAENFPVGIIGCGMSGMAMALQLKSAGFNNFTIFEQSNQIGGTWRDNTYPGCACDIPSHLYSISSAPTPAWSEAFSGQAEIWAYMREVVKREGLTKYIKFGTKVESAEFDETKGEWHLRTKAGEEFAFRVVVMATGPIHSSFTPHLPGLSTFPGKTFHSNAWDHTYDLTHKRVAIIGTGASAVQIIPEIQPKVEQLFVFQRSAGWVLPKPNAKYSPRVLRVLKAVPLLLWLHRMYLYFYYDIVFHGLLTVDKKRSQLESLCLQYLASQVSDPGLRQQLTPTFRLGCKRVLPSNTYYPALCQSNVKLISSAAVKVEGSTVIAEDGTSANDVEVIVFATGFDVAKTYATGVGKVVGLQGKSLQELWGKEVKEEDTGLATGGPEAYYGMTVSGFPNLYLLMGPNSLLGHNSVLVMAEFQAAYILQLLKWMASSSLKYVDVKPEIQMAHNSWLQGLLAGSVWQSGCTSWYQLGHKGRNFTIWPKNTMAYWWETRRVREGDYRAVEAGAESGRKQE